VRIGAAPQAAHASGLPPVEAALRAAAEQPAVGVECERGGGWCCGVWGAPGTVVSLYGRQLRARNRPKGEVPHAARDQRAGGRAAGCDEGARGAMGDCNLLTAGPLVQRHHGLVLQAAREHHLAGGVEGQGCDAAAVNAPQLRPQASGGDGPHAHARLLARAAQRQQVTVWVQRDAEDVQSRVGRAQKGLLVCLCIVHHHRRGTGEQQPPVGRVQQLVARAAGVVAVHVVQPESGAQHEDGRAGGKRARGFALKRVLWRLLRAVGRLVGGGREQRLREGVSTESTKKQHSARAS